MTPDWTNQRDALHHEIAELRGQVDDGKARIAELELLLFGNRECYTRWHLTATEAKVLGLLMHGGLKTRDAFLVMMYGDGHVEPATASRILDLYIFRLRHKLVDDDITIETVWGQGFRMSDKMISRTKQLGSIQELAA